ncbi:long-chain-acyl-CoA synthetase [Aliidiomarina sanyensis]|uniref:Long-chain-acyl-CoA synthetase n=2 Tax=Aliidiomarina sanyensis TaxID=1249555 RepID=A0A432WSC5_9GAMM|nr:long-chain-acyl-CoA synthetase [Aliidiomarina sanyensis]
MTKNNKNMQTNHHTHRFSELFRALVRFAPRIPAFLRANRLLKTAQRSDIGSTGLFLENAARTCPNRIFLRFESEQITYKRFNQQVNQLAHTLAAIGVKKGDCVALLFENAPALLIAVFAVNKLGAVAGMMNHKQRAGVLVHSLDIIQPKMMIIGEGGESAFLSLREHNSGLTETMPCFRYGRVAGETALPDLMERAREASEENPVTTSQVTLGDTSFYVFTSGTTGLPKSAAMTHLRWMKAGVGFGRMALGLRANDIHYCCLPLYHNTALSASLSSVIMTQSSLALARKFSARQFWHDISQHTATTFVYIGELCRYLLNQEEQNGETHHQIRAVLGNGLRSEIWDQFQTRFKIPEIYELYGASEGNIGFVNVFNLKRTVGFSPMTFAIVQYDVEQDQPVVNSKGRMQRVKKGEVGLLLAEVTNTTPFDGYTNNEAASQAKVLKNVFRTGDCWFNTGDLVRDQGFRHIAFIDRVGDTFRWKSENVATTQVEAEIQSNPDVSEAVVYGVAVPHTEGRAGMASVCLRENLSFDGARFYRYLRAKLPDYAVPIFVRIQEGYHETTTTLKIKKSELKKLGYRVWEQGESVYVLVNSERGYEPLNSELLEQIEKGEIRL